LGAQLACSGTCNSRCSRDICEGAKLTAPRQANESSDYDSISISHPAGPAGKAPTLESLNRMARSYAELEVVPKSPPPPTSPLPIPISNPFVSEQHIIRVTQELDPTSAPRPRFQRGYRICVLGLLIACVIGAVVGGVVGGTRRKHNSVQTEAPPRYARSHSPSLVCPEGTEATMVASHSAAEIDRGLTIANVMQQFKHQFKHQQFKHERLNSYTKTYVLFARVQAERPRYRHWWLRSQFHCRPLIRVRLQPQWEVGPHSAVSARERFFLHLGKL
jgi:hypothetical protein